MKGFILLTLVSLAYAKSVDLSKPISAYGYNRKYAIPLAEKIRAEEEAARSSGRIAGGSFAVVGQFPYQAGILTHFFLTNNTGVCGGSLVTPNRVIHAARCWDDGEYTAYITDVVLGSRELFGGGTRVSSVKVVTHPEWDYQMIRNDIAVIKLCATIIYSDTIAPIALPSGDQLNEDYVGETAIASGYGRTGDSEEDAITWPWQWLSYTRLTVISNSACMQAFPWNVVATNICTNGANGNSTCAGDAGGPLALTRDEKPLLIGITSFGNSEGCERGSPSAFTRVTSYMDFLNEHL